MSRRSRKGLSALATSLITYCACCHREFGKELRKTKKFVASGLSHYVDDYEEVDQDVTVSVSAAVEEIQAWRYGKPVVPGLVDSNVAMCTSCGIILAKLYTAVKALEEANSELSYFNEVGVQINTIERDTKATDTDEDKRYEEAYEQAFGGDEFAMYSDSENNLEIPLPTKEDWETAGAGGVRNPYSRRSIKDKSNKDYLCPNCPSGFDKSANLTRHLLLTHGVGHRTKDFRCDVCGKAYYFDHLLKNHQRIHGEARPFICSFPNCSATFKIRRALHAHRIRHREVRPFKCRFCTKSFKDERTHLNHETFVHTMPNSLKPHICEFCKKGYKRISTLHDHHRLKKCRGIVTMNRIATLEVPPMIKIQEREQQDAIHSILGSEMEIVTTGEELVVLSLVGEPEPE